MKTFFKKSKSLWYENKFQECHNSRNGMVGQFQEKSENASECWIIHIYKITSENFSYKILESFCLCVNPVLAEMYVCVCHILYCKHLYVIVRAIYHRECRIR